MSSSASERKSSIERLVRVAAAEDTGATGGGTVQKVKRRPISDLPRKRDLTMAAINALGRIDIEETSDFMEYGAGCVNSGIRARCEGGGYEI